MLYISISLIYLNFSLSASPSLSHLGFLHFGCKFGNTTWKTSSFQPSNPPSRFCFPVATAPSSHAWSTTPRSLGWKLPLIIVNGLTKKWILGLMGEYEVDIAYDAIDQIHTFHNSCLYMYHTILLNNMLHACPSLLCVNTSCKGSPWAAPAARNQVSAHPPCNPQRSKCPRSPWQCLWTPERQDEGQKKHVSCDYVQEMHQSHLAK